MFQIESSPIVALRLTLPVNGIWTAHVDADEDEALTGSVTITDGTQSYVGHVVRSGAVSGRMMADVIGGGGGLAGDVTAKHYRNASVKTVLSEMLSAGGETLAASSTKSMLATQLQFWTRPAGRLSLAVSDLADALGARWRVLADGSVWFGVDTWPDFSGGEPDELDEDHAAGLVLLAPDAFDLVPGVTLGARRVGRVEHLVTEESGLRTTFWVDQ